MQRIENLLRREIGLDAASIGSSLIERTIRLRMKLHGLRRIEDYRKLLDTSSDELRELIEAVVVTETWFFRDRQPFQAFVELVRNEWLPQHDGGVLRVLSVPCSSGEEPYSLAMALLDADFPDTHFAIDAVDISANALARAQRAVYGRNSFRGKDLAFRDRHFQATKEGYALNAQVRRAVKFQCENILDESFLSGRAPYDFVFCRNLMIYFDRTTQIRTLARLQRLLADDGVLFVGPAELPLVSESGFVGLNLPLSFACRKNTDGIARPARQRDRTSLPLATVASATTARSQAPSARNGIAATAAHRANDFPDPLDIARQLADSGQLEEAAAVCEAHLAKAGPTAAAYYLLGLIKDASADPEAVTCYRKALYLEPNHYEALIHIALWLEEHGDADGARAFKRRAERAQFQSPPES